MEKQQEIIYELPDPVPQTPPKKSKLRLLPHFLICLLVLLSFSRHSVLEAILSHRRHGVSNAIKSQCEQPDPLFPSTDNDRLKEMYKHLSSAEFEKGTIARLSGAVQIPTQSFDDMGPIGEDYRWDAMYPFADYLKKTFPKVHEHLEPETVNTHGLVYTYKGSDEDLKPLLLMAHQDTVSTRTSTRQEFSPND